MHKILVLKSDAPEILFSTACLPPVEYMCWLLFSANAEIEMFETYPKQTWRNRFCIPTANGPLALTVPVEKPFGNNTLVHQVKTSMHQIWQKQHWRSIVAAYNKSAFFTFYRDLLEPFFLGSAPELLVDFNEKLLVALISEIGIKANPSRTIRFEKVPVGKLDLRYTISPKINRLPKEQENFLFPAYFQPFAGQNGFLPNQSIIDVLFNLGPDTLGYLDICSKNLANQVIPG